MDWLDSKSNVKGFMCFHPDCYP